MVALNRDGTLDINRPMCKITKGLSLLRTGVGEAGQPGSNNPDNLRLDGPERPMNTDHPFGESDMRSQLNEKCTMLV